MKKKNNSKILKLVFFTLGLVMCFISYTTIVSSMYNNNQNWIFIHKIDEKYFQFNEQKININDLESEPRKNFSIKYKLRIDEKLNFNQLPSEVSTEEIEKNIKFDVPLTIKLISIKPFDESGQLILKYELMSKEINVLINGFEKQKPQLKIKNGVINSVHIETPKDDIFFNGYFIDYEISKDGSYPLKWFLLIPDYKLRYLNDISEINLSNDNSKIKITDFKNIISGKDILDDFYVNLAVVEVNFDNENEAKSLTSTNFDLIKDNSYPFFKKNDVDSIKSLSFYQGNEDNNLSIYTNDVDLNLYLYNFSKSDLLNDYEINYEWIKKIPIRNSYFDTDEADGSPLFNSGYLFIYDNINHNIANIKENNVGLYTPISTVFDNNWSHIKKYCYDFIYGSDNSLQKNWYLSSLVNKYPKIQTKLLNDFRFNNKKWFVGDTNAQLK